METLEHFNLRTDFQVNLRNSKCSAFAHHTLKSRFKGTLKNTYKPNLRSSFRNNETGNQIVSHNTMSSCFQQATKQLSGHGTQPNVCPPFKAPWLAAIVWLGQHTQLSQITELESLLQTKKTRKIAKGSKTTTILVNKKNQRPHAASIAYNLNQNLWELLETFSANTHLKTVVQCILVVYRINSMSNYRL
mgnify:CR=1 FL=1